MLDQLPDADAHNQLSVKRLLRTLRLSQGDFSLILAHCNYQKLQSHLVAQIQQESPYSILRITLEASEKTLFTKTNCVVQQQDNPPDALMIFGLERLENLDRVLKTTNQVRDEFRKQFPFPVVIWVNNEVLKKMIRLAPDFQNWSTSIDFQLASVQLVEALKDGDRTLYNYLLQIGGGQFMPNSRIFGARYRRELTSAIQDLRYRQQELTPELLATLQLVEGRETYEMAYKQRNLEQALALYQQAIESYQASLEFWDSSTDFKRRGCVLYHLGLAWVARGEQHRAEHEPCYRTALTYFWRCIDTFAQMDRPDYEARFINALCFTLQRLNQRPDQQHPQWDELERWATRSLTLQQQYQDQFRLARAYGFLSEVAIARSQWQEAKRLAETAQSILTAELDNPEAEMVSGTMINQTWERSFHQGWYLLALARANLQLGDTSAALQHLQTAQQETMVKYDPELYIRILNQLRHIYFDRNDYGMAFKLRQQRRLIEYQYNFRAFVGAEHLQPKHHITSPAIAPRRRWPKPGQRQAQTGQRQAPSFSPLSAGLHLPHASIDYVVPSDFQTSGRQEDIGRLVNRIASTNHRLTVIHGQSGVGKSSILEAGLLPTLQHNVIGARAVMPIFQQVYADWESHLFQGVINGVERFQQVQSPEFQAFCPGLEGVADGAPIAVLLEQLRWNSRHNVVTVLLFDQFEEFFFVCKDRGDRQRFYQFLKDCLNLSFVNVILALREDYLHCLLDITRTINLDVISNDILSHQILYHIGNFSRDRAKAVIHTLSAQTPFQLEEALINRLVADLAAETGDVSPIELQIVGSQLQTEKITTLREYEQKGPMMQLVQHYLDDALENCGPENQQVAKSLLYALTDEQQLRPLKTLQELVDNSGSGGQAQVELVLSILMGAGMVMEFPEASTRYYQLVHDYLVPLVREDRYSDLLGTLTWTKSRLIQERIRAEVAEVKALNSLSKALLLSHDHLKALMKGVEAAQKVLSIQRHQMNTATQAELGDVLMQIEQDTLNRLRHTLSQVKEVNRIEGHDAKTFGIAFHPKGRYLASGSADHTVRVWGVNGDAIATCEGHRDQVFGVAFSPDGQLLASASADQTIKLWRSSGGMALRTLEGHTDTVFAVVFHPTRPLLASASRDGTIRIWTHTGENTRVFRRGGEAFNVSFSPNGDTFIAGYNDGKIRIWRLDGTLLREIKGHSHNVYGISYSNDGQSFISTSADGTVKQWQMVQGMGSVPRRDPGTLLYQAPSAVFCSALSPDSQLLALTSRDGLVRLCNLEGDLLQTFYGHQSMVYGVCFSPDGRLLASTGDDKAIRLWNLDGIGLHVTQSHQGRILGAAFDSANKLATAGEDGTVKLWQLDGTLLKTFHGHSDLVRQVCFSPDERHLASASNDGTVKIWHLDGSLVHTLTDHYGGVRDIGFSRDGQSFVSAGNDRIVRCWRWIGDGCQTMTPQEFHGARARILSVAISPKSDRLAAVSGRALLIWTITDEAIKPSLPKPHQVPHAHNARILSVCFSPDGQSIATAGADKLIKLWRRDGTWLRTIRGHCATVKWVTFSQDGQYLLSFGSDRTLRIWHHTGTLIKTLRGHAGSICAASWCHDPYRIVSICESGVVKGWQLAPLTGSTNVNDAGSLDTEEREQPCIEFVLDAKTSVLLSNSPTDNLQQLVTQACHWLHDYLTHNPCLSRSDRQCCRPS